MPFRNSRYPTDHDLAAIVNAEDSNDEDYDDRDRSPRKARAKPKQSRPSSAHTKKKRRTAYRGSDISDDGEEESVEEEVWTDEDPADEIETNVRTGRPLRRATKQAKTYEEDSDEEEEAHSATSSDEDVPVTPRKSRTTKQSKIVTLKVRTPLTTNTRSLRERKPSVSAIAPPLSGTRRTRRTSEADGEELIELSNSGRHSVVVRAGSREPDQPARATRGSKSIKYPSKSTIDEEDEPESAPQVEEGETHEEGDLRGQEIPASQQSAMELEVPASQPELPEVLPQLRSDLLGIDELDTEQPSEDPLQVSPLREPRRPEVEPLSDVDEAAEDDDEGPVVSRSRNTRGSQKRKADSPPPDEPAAGRRRLRSQIQPDRPRSETARRPKGVDETSEFEMDRDEEEAEDLSESGNSEESPRKRSQQKGDEDDSSNAGRRSTRLQKKGPSQQVSASEDEDIELAEELAELKKDRGKKRSRGRDELVYEAATRGRRNAGRKNYDLLKGLPQIEEDDDEPTVPSLSQRARKKGTGWQRGSLFNIYGPFGGAGINSVFGGAGQPPEADIDSSDEETMKQPKAVGGMVGMTPTTAANPFNPFALPHNADAAQAGAGTPANLGKIKDKQALADADPLGVDQNVDFDSVGGLQGHIDQLKEMVALPLLYPEIFMRFKITPPRGVLFHGPPGTGKTLLARALATSVSSEGRKVTFYMRKGADALSKWVGEAERQLRMLFEEARKTQPSIIFFDEIDGLAPVRSSKQEQIHASIVSTLLALMDGMDGRGQVIVIGATNRPDSVDPALRRPGRFDREFYFPLPDVDARRSIIQIHTKGWSPPLDDNIKDELALLTKGYGGADLRALCTEAALNAVQRRYPQIYSSKEKLLIDPKTIHVTPKDFMISIKKMTPSSERSAASGAAPLPSSVAPLLAKPFEEITALVSEMLPQKKKTTALEEAMFEDVADGNDFGRERMQSAFESSRVFRPRLLIHGKLGMGQQYVAAALLNHFQGIHVQSFDLSTLLSDTTSSPEATVIRLFTEVKMHKPSVIYIPNVQEWFGTVGPTVLTTFFGLLRSIKPTDPILVMGFAEADPDQEDAGMKRELFGYTPQNQYMLESPRKHARAGFFAPLKQYIKTKPSDFPNPAQRKLRQIEILPPAPPEPVKPPKPPTQAEIKAQKQKDRLTLNLLKTRLQPIMEQIKLKHKKFKTGVIDEGQIRYLYDEADPGTVTSDLAEFPVARASFRPFEIGKDAHGVVGLVDQATNKFYYNLDTITIEKRLSNGYYKRGKDFTADIKKLVRDAATCGDEARLLNGKEMLTNVLVDIDSIEKMEPILTAECEKVFQREEQRQKEAQDKQQAAANSTSMPPPQSHAATTTTEGTGPINLGDNLPIRKDLLARAAPTTPSRPPSNSTSILTNGFHTARPEQTSNRESNHTGSGHEADVEGDTPMQDSQMNSASKTSGETQDTTSTTGATSSAQPRPFHMHTAPSQQLLRDYGMLPAPSQTGVVTPMQAGSQLADYVNQASTTQTSSGGQKQNSGPSPDDHAHGHDHEAENNQEYGPGPNLFPFDDRRSAGTDIPDTQVTDNPASQSSANGTSAYASAVTPARPASQGHVHSQPLSQLSNSLTPPVPAFTAPTNPRAGPTSPSKPALSNILNPPSPPLPQQNKQKEPEPGPEPNLTLPSDTALSSTLTEITDQTSGLSVEQLEQVNSVLMDVLWKTRGEWDRRKVLDAVIKGFNGVLEDMRRVGQEFGQLSWEARGMGRRDG